MNPQEQYTALIHYRAINPLPPDVYGEVHHIYPRCLGGNDEPENLIRLTPEEHYRAHCLLPFIFTEGIGHAKLCCAWHRMRFAQGKDVEISEEEYGRLKRAHSKALSETKKGEVHSEEHNRKVSQAKMGKHLSEAHRKAISESHLKGHYTHTEEWKKAASERNLGKKWDADFCRKVSEGKKKAYQDNPEVRARISAALKEYNRKKREQKCKNN